MDENQKATLVRLYERFNARDIEAVIAMLHPDVDWPNGWEGGRERGRDAVRAYWLRQWAEINPSVVPVTLEAIGDVVRVHVHQVVRGLDGTVLSDSVVLHDYRFTDGLVTRMDFGDRLGCDRGKRDCARCLPLTWADNDLNVPIEGGEKPH